MNDERVDRSHLGKGEYADFFDVGQDFVAFYLDCGQLGDSEERTKVYNRIITSPIGAQRLAGVLAKALREYVRRFGSIRDESGEVVREEKDEY